MVDGPDLGRGLGLLHAGLGVDGDGIRVVDVRARGRRGAAAVGRLGVGPELGHGHLAAVRGEGREAAHAAALALAGVRLGAEVEGAARLPEARGHGKRCGGSGVIDGLERTDKHARTSTLGRGPCRGSNRAWLCTTGRTL